MSRIRIGIVETGAANRANIDNALVRAGAQPMPVATAKDARLMDAIVVPGVANVGYIMRRIDACGLRAPLLEAIAGRTPVLAICAGFQVLFERSDEAPDVRLLGAINGVVRKIDGPRRQHVGWNRVVPRADQTLIDEGWAYFTHGYAVVDDIDEALAHTTFGKPFASAVRIGNTFGLQFHPERSGSYGAALLRSFVQFAGGR